MKASWGVAIQPRDPLRRGQSRAFAGVRNHLNTITKTGGANAVSARRPPLEQSKLQTPPAATAAEHRPVAAATRELLRRHLNPRTSSPQSSKRMAAVCVSRRMRPSARSLDARTAGRWRRESWGLGFCGRPPRDRGRRLSPTRRRQGGGPRSHVQSGGRPNTCRFSMTRPSAGRRWSSRKRSRRPIRRLATRLRQTLPPSTPIPITTLAISSMR